MKALLSKLWLAASLLVAPVALLAQTTSGTAAASVSAIDGTVSVTRADGRQLLLSHGSILQVGDAIHTARNSSVRLKFIDGGETLVRPESVLQVEACQFQPDAPAADQLQLRLIQGGLRAQTGEIGKRGNQDAYQVLAKEATVGIRGTDFSLRLCQKDCTDKLDPDQRNTATPVAARAVQVRGTARVSRRGASAVALMEGQPLYSGDALQTLAASHVVLVFTDGSRVTVNPFSQMAIAQYLHDHQAKSADGDSMVVDMFKGGLRFATGLIGKASPQKVKVRTPTASIGIRGTVFDAVCAPSSSADDAGTAAMGDMPCEESLFAQTREGLIALAGAQGQPVLLAAGQSGRVSGPDAPARTLEAAPDYFREQTTPAPESVPFNLEVLFGTQLAPEITDGVFLSVNAGRVVLAQAQQQVFLDAGESAFAPTGLPPLRLFSAPPVVNQDVFLSSGMFRPNMCRP